MFVNSVECLIRNGYQIHVISTGEICVYFAFDSQALQQEVWNRDAELIRAFIGERKITAYYTFAMNQVPAPLPTATDAEPVVAEEPVAELITEPLDQPVAEPVAEPVFKPDLELCLQPPTQSPDFLETLTGANNEYVVYAKENNSFHVHWNITRQEAKEVWRRDRESIRQWLGADTLNSVSWEEPVADIKAPKWKEVSSEETKLITVLRQVVAFGKPVADLAQLDDGTYHVYFHVPKEEAKRVHAHIKSEFTGYKVTSVSFEEHLTRRQEWVDEFHCVDPIATEHDSVAVSDKELYRFLTQRIDSLIQDDTFCHNGHCWTLKDSDLSLSTLLQLAFRVPFFSVDAQESASRIAHTLLNGKTVILTE